MKRFALTILAIAAVAATVFVALNRPGAEASPGTTIRVNSTADTRMGDNHLTLREAMMLATGELELNDLNQMECGYVIGADWEELAPGWWTCYKEDPPGPASADTIDFSTSRFPPGNPATINLASALPLLSTGDDTVDGSSAGVIVDGGGKGIGCFDITSSNNTIKGLEIYDCYTGVDIREGAQGNTVGGTTENERNVISGHYYYGVRIFGIGTDDNVVRGNYIGTDASGTAALPNRVNGMYIATGAQNNTVEDNLISGNGVGVLIRASPQNTIRSNLIGTNASGTDDLLNGVGVYIHEGASDNTIGGSSPGDRNVISGNYGCGVELRDSGTSGNAVKGNYMGTNASGTAALSNLCGVWIYGGASATIGGSSPGDRNVISGNIEYGVLLDTDGNVVEGNYIGTDASGTAGLPNGAEGVAIFGWANNTIGGSAAGQGNLIAYNRREGVLVRRTTATGNSIRGNSIHSNDWKGIENIDGGNTELAPPVITGFGSVLGTACPNCTVDIYSDDEDEGRVYEGSTTADGDGNWSFGGSLEGPNVTATATDDDGNTSEFSAPVEVPEATATPSPTPTPTAAATATPTPPTGSTRTLVWSPGWHNETWSGASTPEEAFACAAGKYAAAYRFTDTGLERYFPDRPDISNMAPLAQFDAFLILITQPVTCTMPVAAGSDTSRTLEWASGWHNEGWSGADGTASEDAFACADGSYAAAYRFTDAGLERYFPGRPDIANMGPLAQYDAFLILITQPVSCAMSISP